MLKPCFLVLAILHFTVITAVDVKDDPWNGEEYNQNSSSQKDAASDLLKYNSLNGDEYVLDIGSGDGKITAMLAKQLAAGEILGIDISPSMVEFAARNFPKEEYPNLEFELMSAEQMSFSPIFNYIFSFTTLQWIKDHPLVIAKVKKSLKLNGSFAATMPMGLPYALGVAVNEAMQQANWKEYFIDFDTGWNFVTAKQYEEYLKSEGFAIRRLEVVRQKDIFPSLEIFRGFISQWFPYLRPLPKEEKEVFMNQVLTRYIELDPLDESGQLHFKINRLEVIAEKK